MKKRIYIETTIPSFYYEVRNDPEMAAMREWTKNWWNYQKHHYDLVTSIPVISYHNCHFLLTWNCSHLAKANKFEHIRHINTMLGLYVHILTTPFELLHWEEETS